MCYLICYFSWSHKSFPLLNQFPQTTLTVFRTIQSGIYFSIKSRPLEMNHTTWVKRRIAWKRAFFSILRSLFVVFVLTVNYSPVIVYNNAKWLCFLQAPLKHRRGCGCENNYTNIHKTADAHRESHQRMCSLPLTWKWTARIKRWADISRAMMTLHMTHRTCPVMNSDSLCNADMQIYTSALLKKLLMVVVVVFLCLKNNTH